MVTFVFPAHQIKATLNFVANWSMHLSFDTDRNLCNGVLRLSPGSDTRAQTGGIRDHLVKSGSQFPSNVRIYGRLLSRSCIRTIQGSEKISFLFVLQNTGLVISYRYRYKYMAVAIV